jgi:hypothetical protein
MRSSVRVLFFILLWAGLSSVALASPAPVFAGPDVVNGKAVELSPSQAKKATVVVFLSASCPCSASPAGVQFVAVHSNSDESADLARIHFKASELPFPIIQDEGAKIATGLKAFKTPHVFVFDPRGEILFQGGVDDSHIAATAKKHYLREALVAIGEGKRPPVSEVRTLGCIIKRP